VHGASGAFDFEISETRIQRIADRRGGLRRAAVAFHTVVPSFARRDVGDVPCLPGALCRIVSPHTRSFDGVTPDARLTRLWWDVALRLLRCEARMSELLADIVSAYGRDLDPESLAKTRRYLETLSSAVRTDDLPAYGLAYLEQLHNPDPRYTGC
jgi:hypothetical protein